MCFDFPGRESGSCGVLVVESRHKAWLWMHMTSPMVQCESENDKRIRATHATSFTTPPASLILRLNATSTKHSILNHSHVLGNLGDESCLDDERELREAA
jgi:hypothetical protein